MSAKPPTSDARRADDEIRFIRRRETPK